MRLIFVALASLGIQINSIGQLLYDTAMWVPNGPVHSMVRYNNDLIIGGDFNYVGKALGYGMAVDTVNGVPVFYGFPEVDGPVYAVFPDTWGGWFIGGDFTLVGGQPRKNLAHISKSGHLYPGFNPSPDGAVYAIWVVPSNASSGIPRPEVYVGGDFTIIGGETRHHLAVLNPYNGAPYINWDPVLNGRVRCITGKGRSTVYVGGDFTLVNGYSKLRLAEFNQVNGAVYVAETLKVFNNAFNASVEALYYAYGELFIGGAFTTVDNQQRKYLVKYIAGADSIDTGFNPGVNGPVYTIGKEGYVVKYGSTGPPPPARIGDHQEYNERMFMDTTILFGGFFSLVGGQPRINIAEVSTTDGSVTSLNIQTNGPVNSLNWSKRNGDIFIGGNFTLVNGQPRRHFAQTDSLGAIKNLQFNVSDPVRCLALSDSLLYLGGEFVCRDGVERNNIAAIDLTTKTAGSFNIGADRYVSSMVLTGTGKLLVGGNFLALGGQPRMGVGGIDLNTNSVMPFVANANGLVRTVTYIGNKMYFGGLFSTVNNIPRTNMGCVNIVTGQLENWHPDPNGTVNSIEAGSDRIWVGGYYTSIGGFQKNHLAVVDTLGGYCITSFNAAVNDGIYDLDVDGSRLYLGGWFSTLGSQPRSNAGMMDPYSAAVSSFNPNPSNYVRSVQQIDPSTVVIGGDFTLVGGQDRDHMALVTSATGTLLPLNPGLNRAPLCYIKENNILYTGGLHTAISGRVHAFLNAINLQYTPGFPESDYPHQLLIYPNPAGEFIMVSLASPVDGMSLVIRDMTGREVLRVIITGAEAMLNISDLTPGIYMVGAEGGHISFQQKLIITR
ncbi:MAG: T9SS type A sorting domain-containing protein [Bacteroidia bacterium]|nr:T9SS type A sorting domain-containing protein [Bacteroidia bacterium]